MNSVMESLEDFFQDWEKQYSQHVDMNEQEIIKQRSIKTRRNSFDTEKLKQNAKLRTERAKIRLKRQAELVSSHEKSSNKRSSQSRSGSRSVKKKSKGKSKSKKVAPKQDSQKVKSSEFTLKVENKPEKIKSMMKKYKKEASSFNKQSFNTTRNKIMSKIKKLNEPKKISPSNKRKKNISNNKLFTKSVININENSNSKITRKRNTFNSRRNSWRNDKLVIKISDINKKPKM